MPNFARRKNNIHDLFYSKKRKLSVQQNFQRILAEEAAASTNENRVNNKFPPDEPMVECRAADEHMSERDKRNDGRGVADEPFSDSDASFVLARDDSMSSDDDDDQNDFIFDDMFGLEATDDGPTDDGQSLKTTSASRQGANVNGNPQVMMYQDEEEQPPTAEDDIEFTNLEVAELELLMLCDASGARRQFFDDLLTLLRRFHKKRIDITKAKGHASFMATMESKVKCPKPFSKKVEGRDVIYFPFFDSLQDLLRSSAFYDIDNLCANKAEQDCFNHFQPTTVADNSEIMSNEWASKMQDQLAADKDFDPDQDYFLALQVYGDKTGTDVNQRYPLEPWMFTLVALQLMARQDPKNWRHLGLKYTPSGTPTGTLGDQCSRTRKQESGDSKLGQRKLQEQHSSMDEMSSLKARRTALERCSCLTPQGACDEETSKGNQGSHICASCDKSNSHSS
jgi:hypothetical protein